MQGIRTDGGRRVASAIAARNESLGEPVTRRTSPRSHERVRAVAKNAAASRLEEGAVLPNGERRFALG